MNVKTKAVYYCDHCRKHGLSRHSMERHEQGCTMNPARACGWQTGGCTSDIGSLAVQMKERAISRDGGSPTFVKDDIDWLHDEVEGCPACMLSALRQSGIEIHYDHAAVRIFDYDDQVLAFRKKEGEEGDRNDYLYAY